MKRFIKYFFSVILILSCSLLTSGCNKKSKNTIPENLYNSSGEHIAFYYEGFIYDVSSKVALAQYDKSKKVFYNKNGYYGEIVKNKYLLYNLNSTYKDYEFSYMKIAPIAPYHKKQKKIDKLNLGTDSNKNKWMEFINLNTTNYSKYGISVSSELNGYAAFYVYLKTELQINNLGYEIYNTIEVDASISISYVGHHKEDYSKTRTFSSTKQVTVTSNTYTSSVSIYNLTHKDYSFFSATSINVRITDISGQISVYL